MDKDDKIFKNKSFADLLSEIYDNSKKKEKKINDLMEKLIPMVESKGDAVILVPLIKGYLEQGIKIDDNLIKMAAIVQRVMISMNEKDEPQLSDHDMEDLYNQAKQINIKISKE